MARDSAWQDVIVAVASPERVADADATLFRLLTWLSPAFPVGAFAYSSGIEWAVEASDIRDAQTLREWLTAMLSGGAGLSDGIFLCHSYRAAAARDVKTFLAVAELASAFVSSRERQLETTMQGRAFMEIARSAWGCDTLDWLAATGASDIVYPVAVGVLGAGHRIALKPLLHSFLHAQLCNWISAGGRLIPLGQTDSQKVLAALEADLAQTAARAIEAGMDDVGSSTLRADIASMRHETQYTRLFRS